METTTARSCTHSGGCSYKSKAYMIRPVSSAVAGRWLVRYGTRRAVRVRVDSDKFRLLTHEVVHMDWEALRRYRIPYLLSPGVIKGSSDAAP